jgi:hypothetical protein
MSTKSVDWQPIATAPTDGTVVWVYAAAREDLPAFQTWATYNPHGGWCVDEVRYATHWVSIKTVAEFLGNPE